MCDVHRFGVFIYFPLVNFVHVKYIVSVIRGKVSVNKLNDARYSIIIKKHNEIRRLCIWLFVVICIFRLKSLCLMVMMTIIEKSLDVTCWHAYSILNSFARNSIPAKRER